MPFSGRALVARRTVTPLSFFLRIAVGEQCVFLYRGNVGGQPFG